MNLRKTIYFATLMVLLVVSTFIFATASENQFLNNLPKTKDMVPLDKTEKASKGADDKTKTKEGADTSSSGAVQEVANEEEKPDPARTYKLTAVYLIDNEPRALIRNVLLPDDGAMEYKVGDYLDESGVFLISQILFNPTIRIKLTDVDGLSYLIKPQDIDKKDTSKGLYGSKTTPSYFSQGQGKYKFKKSAPPVLPGSEVTPLPSTTEPQAPQPSSPPPAPASSTTAPAESQAVESAIKKDETSGTSKTQGQPTTSLQAVTTGSTQVSTSSGGDVKPASAGGDLLTRPKDPFSP